MIHSLNVDIAEKVGANAALIYQSIQFWCKKNKANKSNFHDEKYWTFNSVKAWQELFPYMGASAIKTALKKLEDENFISVGVYNKNPYDRTKWYSVNGLDDNSQATKDDNDESSITLVSTQSKEERESFLETWNENAEVVGIPKLRVLNDDRYKKLQQRIKANENFLDDLAECLGRVSGSQFIQNNSWFGFDWLVANDTNYVKVLEGSYDNK